MVCNEAMELYDGVDNGMLTWSHDPDLVMSMMLR